MGPIHIMEHYLALKNGEILTHATQRAFCQVSQSYNGKYHMISKLHEKPSHQTCTVNKNNGYKRSAHIFTNG